MTWRWLRRGVLLALFVWIGRRVDLPRFWVYAAIWCTLGLYASIAADPSLFRERLRPTGPTVDRWSLLAIRVLAAFQLIIALVDIDRFHWSDTVPQPLRVAAMIAFAASITLAVRAMVVNRFFSTAVRVQADRGHRVVSDGPYRFVRHPGYLGMLLAAPAGALALGSWWALVPALAYSLLIFRRARLEDRYLREHLDGYAEYTRRVGFRLIPGVW